MMDISQISDEELRKLTDTMKAMAHPLRLKILCKLKSGELNVTELENALGEPQAKVSQQLRILRMNGLVSSKRVDGFSYYSLDTDKKSHIEKIMTNMCSILR